MRRECGKENECKNIDLLLPSEASSLTIIIIALASILRILPRSARPRKASVIRDGSARAIRNREINGRGTHVAGDGTVVPYRERGAVPVWAFRRGEVIEAASD